MVKAICALVFLSAIFAADVANGGEMQPGQPASIEFDWVRGSAVYTAEAQGFRVEATLTGRGSPGPMRFVTTLADGQRAVIAVPRAFGMAWTEVEFARAGDIVTISAPSHQQLQAFAN